MYTRCPKCLTWFNVTEEQLGAARGRVRCGQCLVLFDASSRLWSEPDEALAPVLRGVAAGPRGVGRPAATDSEPEAPPEHPDLPKLPEISEISEELGGAEQLDPFHQALPDDPLPPSIDIEEEVDIAFDLDSEPAGPRIGDVRRVPAEREVAGMRHERIHGGRVAARHRRAHEREILTRIEGLETRRRRRWPASSCIGLLLLLAVQYTWFMAGDLAAAFPAIGPAIDEFCAATGCRTNLHASRHHVRVVARKVRPHAQYAGALMVDATLESRAEVARAFPAMRFVLYGQDGRAIASRTFEPVEYLGVRAVPLEGIGPGSRVDIGFELLIPSKVWVSFDLRPV